ncbi:MAG: methyltransferase domain-containing protein [Desulfotomaculaceae bacterium]|nr:methyltransferase domain-containing protein [Desulfotomaculaceae bacterium]
MRSTGIEDNSVDIVISNCVINLSPYKEKVFEEICRVLKPGGELYFSDVFADRRIPEHLAIDPVLRGECIGGAMYSEDFRRIMERSGFVDFRYKSSRALDLLLVCGNTASMLSKTRFASAFKVIGDRLTHYGAFDGCGTPCEPDYTNDGSSCC